MPGEKEYENEREVLFFSLQKGLFSVEKTERRNTQKVAHFFRGFICGKLSFAESLVVWDFV